MFMKLKDGKVVNLLEVSLVKPFDAVADAPMDASPVRQHETAVRRARFIEKNFNFHAEIIFASEKSVSGLTKPKTLKIEETPEEFLQSANRQMLEAGLVPHLKN